jgi:nitrogen fixation protein FixH
MNYKLLIIGILFSVLVVIGASVAIGILSRDIEVEENAYEAGLHFDHVRHRQAALGWKVELPRNANRGETELVIRVLDRDNAGLGNASVELQLSRMGEHRVSTYQCVGTGNGGYRAHVGFDRAGYWDAQVLVRSKNDTLSYSDKIDVQEFAVNHAGGSQ